MKIGRSSGFGWLASCPVSRAHFFFLHFFAAAARCFFFLHFFFAGVTDAGVAEAARYSAAG